MLSSTFIFSTINMIVFGSLKVLELVGLCKCFWLFEGLKVCRFVFSFGDLN